jgi:hypothetical protein
MTVFDGSMNSMIWYSLSLINIENDEFELILFCKNYKGILRLENN